MVCFKSLKLILNAQEIYLARDLLLFLVIEMHVLKLSHTKRYATMWLSPASCRSTSRFTERKMILTAKFYCTALGALPREES